MLERVGARDLTKQTRTNTLDETNFLKHTLSSFNKINVLCN